MNRARASRPPRRPLRPVPALDAVAEDPFSPIAERLAAHEGPIFPLHVGDTWMEPFDGGRMEDLHVDEHPGMHRYTDTRGVPALVDALVEKVRHANGLPCERESVLVTGGATGALASAVGMLAEPGDEVLILAPYWPLIRGIVTAMRAVPVEVPFYDRVATREQAQEAVSDMISSRSVALYVSSPSNPTGRVLPPAWLEALAELAARRDLWLLSDEVYEDYVYAGSHCSPGRVAPERSLSVFSFSKAYGMAGNRCGYLVGPPEAVAGARKVATHTFYHSPTAAQLAALRALEGGARWVESARGAYRRAGESAARALGLPPPEGGTFLFLDLRPHLGARGIWGFLEACLEDGVLLAPGISCGAAYGDWARVCYTAAPPRQVEEAVRRVAARVRGDPRPAG